MTLIIDVRTAEEHARRRVEGAINIDFRSPDFVSRILALPKDEQYIVYCNAGGRAGRAKTRMTALGFTDVTAYGIMGASVASGRTVLYANDPSR